MRSHAVLLPLPLAGAALLAAAASVSDPPQYRPPNAARVAEVETDWLRQEAARAHLGKPISTAEDAAGAVDGVKDGKWGFHTNLEPDPWWQVDLGRVQPLDRVLVYNRCDCPERMAHLAILLSDDGANWSEAFRNRGTIFYGATDGKPLVVALGGRTARYVRAQLPESGYLHLDEVEVYGASAPQTNLALGRPADQSSTSQWSARHVLPGARVSYPIDAVIERGRRLAAYVAARGADVRDLSARLEAVARTASALGDDAPETARRAAYLEARWVVRRIAFANPEIDFDRILFVKRAPGVFSHMSDQNYGWWSRPGGGIFLLEGFRSDAPRVRCLTPGLPPGSCLSPELSYDGRKVLFAYCRFHPGLASLADKETKANVPEDAFYHLFEMNIDGSGLVQITRGKYDDFDGRYLPDGSIVFLSTRRGQFVQCGKDAAMATLREPLHDSYVRCGGDASRPVAVYTLHKMDPGRTSIQTLSPFESFEWTPSVTSDGRILYARWDYVDRDNMPYMKLWSMNPDGTNPQAVYGNFTRAFHCAFEARQIPGSHKIVFTASGHHSITGGSLVLLDPRKGLDGPEPITRLTPEVCFPEAEGWPTSYYNSPWPLSEHTYLAAWSFMPIGAQGATNPTNAMGVYLVDADGNLELLYRDPDISSVCPIPVRPRTAPPASPGASHAGAGDSFGTLILADVYDGLKGVARGSVQRLRVVGLPAKTQPTMNSPYIGQTHDDPGKFVIGTVPVERDGSAHFRVPAGVPIFFQALDAEGRAIQTMRSITYVQPGRTFSCIGCHEPRNTAPAVARPLAAARRPSRIAVGPEGSWPLRFDRLVQPALDRLCVGCHSPGSARLGGRGAHFDLTATHAYESLVAYGSPSLRDHVIARYREGRSAVDAGAARTSALLALLEAGHHGVRLDPDARERLITWMDTYAQYQGHYSAEQENALLRARRQWADILVER
jgi:hypothetical protein